jgi:hypothetical protein
MPRPSKLEVEMAYGKAMLELLQIDSTLEARNPPAPDLVFCHKNTRIGIEHTRLFADEGFSPTSFQAYENIIEDIAERCRVAYVMRGLPPVEVKLHLSHEYPSKMRIPILVDWIVNAVADNPESREIRNEWTGEMPHEINSIRMFRFPSLTVTSFYPPRASWIKTVEIKWLQGKVDEKADRVPGYLSDCNEVWLLMVEEQTGLASTVEVPDALWSQPLKHRGFARIYFLRRKTDLHRMLEAA